MEPNNGKIKYTFDVNSIFEDHTANFKTTIYHNLIERPEETKNPCLVCGEGDKYCNYQISPTPEIGKDNFPFPSNENCNWKQGQLLKVEKYDSYGNPVSKTVYNYQNYYKSLGEPKYIYGLKYSRTYHPVYEKECGICLELCAIPREYCGECEPGNPQYVYGRFKIATGVARRVSSTVEKVFDLYDATKFTSVTKTYNYNSYGQLSLITTENLSDGTKKIEKYQYVSDYSVPAAYIITCTDEKATCYSKAESEYYYCYHVLQNPEPGCWSIKYQSLLTCDSLFNDCLTGLTTEVKAIVEMQERHQLTPLVEKQEFNRETVTDYLTGGTLIKYKNFGEGIIMPEKVYTIKNTSPISFHTMSSINSSGNLIYQAEYGTAPDRVNDLFDTQGNLLQSHIPNDVYTSYLYGYNNTYPIAQAINAAHSEIFFTSFEEPENAKYVTSKKHTGNYSYAIPSNDWITIHTCEIPRSEMSDNYNFSIWYNSGTATGSQLANFGYRIRNESGTILSELSYYQGATNNTWKYVQQQFDLAAVASSNPGVQTFTVQLIFFTQNTGYTIYLDDFRFHPTGGQLTTYTYKPLVGMTSGTDENEVTTYYEYDDLGRLTTTRDDDGHIINQTGYHYKPYINLSNSSITIKSPLSQEVALSTNGPWNVTSKPLWITVFPSSGTAIKNVTITCDEYENLNTPRTGIVTFGVTGGAQADLTVIQEGAKFLNVSPLILWFDYYTSDLSATVQVSSNIPWQAAIRKINGLDLPFYWLGITPNSANGDQQVTIDVINLDQLPQGSVWEAWIDFIDPSGSEETISVKTELTY